eukprot:TRINITY_DN21077_c0_g1_i1.p1 TRINITY_DN21077_c0_g1~~TRINITY_DN21077_c0_g1_i1.p1  ORF type:complete len:228 (+),score=44.84 TRINITY_DN21077_c0_g1_i1:47-730(+)
MASEKFPSTAEVVAECRRLVAVNEEGAALSYATKFLNEKWSDEDDDCDCAELASLLTISGELKSYQKEFTSALLDLRRALRMLVSLTGKGSERVLQLRLKICSVLLQQKRHIHCMEMLIAVVKCRPLTSDDAAMVLAYSSTCLMEGEHLHKMISNREQEENLLGNRDPLEGCSGSAESRSSMRVLCKIEQTATALIVTLLDCMRSEAESLAANYSSILRLTEVSRNI